MSEEIREFKMHNNLMHTIIFKQSGSFEKAITELIMNSIDANSTRIDIDFDSERRIFSITDDGKGFTTEEEIESYFDTLGTPHKDGDAKFGRFRIGRTQIFAYASTVWRSGTFRMSVDFLNNENDGLCYKLEKNLPFQKGCIIDATIYNNSDINCFKSIELVIDSVFRDYFCYSDIPIYVNSELRITPNSLCNWDMETENAYYKFNDYRGAYVYNMGAFVKKFEGSYFGIGIDILTKKALDINFARNDIILYYCNVFKEIKKEIQQYVNKNSLKKNRLSIDEKKYFFNQFLKRELEYNAIRSVKLFTDVFEKDFSLEDFVKVHRVTFSDGKSGKLAEMVHNSKTALVFNSSFMYLCDNQNFDSFICSIWGMYDLLRSHYNKEHPSYINLIKDSELLGEQEIVDNIEDFKSLFIVEHKVLTATELNEKEAILLKAIRRLNDIFYKEHKKALNCTKRKIVIGESLASKAWTDGVSYIAINKKYIPVSDFGIKFFDYVLKLIIHEYCHNEFTSKEHPHNQEFYKLYHDLTLRGGFNELKDGLVLNISNLPKRAALVYHNELERNGINTPKTLKQELSHLQENIENDNVESILRSFGRSYWWSEEDISTENTFEEYIQELFLIPNMDDNILYRYILTKNKILEFLIKNENFSAEFLFKRIDNISNFVDFIIANLFRVYSTYTMGGIRKNINALIESYNNRERDYSIEKEIRKEINEPNDYRKALKFIYKSNKKEFFRSNEYGFSLCIVENDTYDRLILELGHKKLNILEKLEVDEKLLGKFNILKQYAIEARVALALNDYKTYNKSIKESHGVLNSKKFVLSTEQYKSFESLGFCDSLKILNLFSIFEYSENQKE